MKNPKMASVKLQDHSQFKQIPARVQFYMWSFLPPVMVQWNELPSFILNEHDTNEFQTIP